MRKALHVHNYGGELPAEWAQIHKTRTWDSPTPDTEVQGMAAWSWIQHWWTARLGDANPPVLLSDGWASSLLQFRSVYLDLDRAVYFYAVAAKKWGSWPMSLQRPGPPTIMHLLGRHPNGCTCTRATLQPLPTYPAESS